MPQAELKQVTDQEIKFRFGHLWGWFFLPMGLAPLLLLLPSRDLEGRLWFGGFAAVMTILSVLTVLRRFELLIDLKSGTWHRRQGFWPQVAASSGPVSDIRAVAVKAALGPSQTSGAKVRYKVTLIFESPQWSSPLQYALVGRAEKAYTLAHEVADRLGVPVVEKEL